MAFANVLSAVLYIKFCSPSSYRTAHFLYMIEQALDIPLFGHDVESDRFCAMFGFNI